MKLCNEPTDVHGAFGCPREAGHSSEHYWWLPFEHQGCWRVAVYWGAPAQRRYVARGAFVRVPTAHDVAALLVTIGELHRREQRRREERKRCPEPPSPPSPAPKPRPRRKVPTGPSLAERSLRAAARKAAAAG